MENCEYLFFLLKNTRFLLGSFISKLIIEYYSRFFDLSYDRLKLEKIKLEINKFTNTFFLIKINNSFKFI